MFESIAILPNKAAKHPLDVGMLAEKMLYYKNVIVFAHKDELVTLFNYFDIDLLVEYLKSGYIRIVNRKKAYAVGKLGDTYIAEFMFDTKYDLQKIIYDAYFAYSNDEQKSKKVATRLYKYVGIYETPSSLTTEINQDLSDPEFIQKALSQSVDYYDPQGVNTPVGLNFIVKPQADGKLTIESSIDTVKHPFLDPSSVVLNIGTALENTKIAADYSTELSAPLLNSKLIAVKVNSLITKAVKSEREIEVFQYAEFPEGPSLQQAINGKHRSMAEFLDVLKEGERFKEWLTGLGEGNKLIKEYTAKVSEKTWIQSMPSKSARFYLVQGLSTILKSTGTLTGIATGIGLSAANTFLVERLGKGWRPHHFIEKKVIPFVQGEKLEAARML